MSNKKETYEVTVVLQVTRDTKEYTKSDVFQTAKEILQGASGLEKLVQSLLSCKD